MNRHWLEKISHGPAFLLVGVGPVVFPLSPGLVTPLTGLFLISVVLQSIALGRGADLVPRDWRAPGVVLALFALGAASITWSIAPDRSLDRVEKLLPLVVLLLVALSPATVKAVRPIGGRLLFAGAVACMVGAGIAAADIAFSLPLAVALDSLAGGDGSTVRPSFYNRGLTFVLLIGFPCLAWLIWSGRTTAAALLTGFVCMGGFVGSSNAMALGILVAAVVAAVGLRFPAHAGWGLFAGTSAAALVQPFAFWGVANRFGEVEWQQSSFHRLEIWDYVSLGIVQRPILGWGIDVTRLLPTIEDRRRAFEITEEIANHAHNNFLEAWNNLGILGLLLLLALVLAGIRATLALPRRRALTAIGLGAVAAILVIAFVAYGLWQTTWIAALAACVVLFRLMADVAATDPGPQPIRGRRWRGANR